MAHSTVLGSQQQTDPKMYKHTMRLMLSMTLLYINQEEYYKVLINQTHFVGSQNQNILILSSEL